MVTGAPPRVLFIPLGVAATNELRYLLSDGFTNSAEAAIAFVTTNSPSSDVDADGMPDAYELAQGLDPFVNDAGLDEDADSLTSLQEFQLGTKPRVADTDNDELKDGAEVARGTLPLNPDTDGDGIRDGIDPDPLVFTADQDGDGLPDSTDPDIDGDGLANTDETTRGTNSRDPDTDRDGWPDGVELEFESNPLLSSSVPVLFHVAQPEVGLILPTLTATAGVTNELTVAQPEAGLILPAFAEFAELTNGVTIGQPLRWR